jgi:hypothetical protein
MGPASSGPLGEALMALGYLTRTRMGIAGTEQIPSPRPIKNVLSDYICRWRAIPAGDMGSPSAVRRFALEALDPQLIRRGA